MTDSEHEPVATFVSHPKAGRTWLRYVFHLLELEVHFTHAGSGTTSRYLGRPFAGVDRGEIRGARVVFMHRNPIDTAVSFYFQVQRKDLPYRSFRWFKRWLPYTLAHRMPPHRIDDFVLHPGLGVPKICAFDRAWMDALQEDPNALVLTYEEAREHTVDTFTRLFAFLGVDVPDVAKIVHESSFDRMKSLESSGRFQHLMLSEGKTGDPESRKVRRGKIQGYRDYLSPGTIEACQRIAREHGFEA